MEGFVLFGFDQLRFISGMVIFKLTRKVGDFFEAIFPIENDKLFSLNLQFPDVDQHFLPL